MDRLNRGGELVCADIDGAWVAGMFNLANPESYDLGSLGIRDADDAVRQKRVVAALIVRSLEQAVELGRGQATLGRSLPFLGKGPVWSRQVGRDNHPGGCWAPSKTCTCSWTSATPPCAACLLPGEPHYPRRRQ